MSLVTSTPLYASGFAQKQQAMKGLLGSPNLNFKPKPVQSLDDLVGQVEGRVGKLAPLVVEHAQLVVALERLRALG